MPGTDRLVEELTAFDDTTMSLTYALASGMDHVARSARSTWTVAPLSTTRSVLRIDAEFDLAPTGRVLVLLLHPYLAAMGRRNADDLKVFAETGSPSSRKQRQQQGRGPLAGLIAGNAVFTTLCGAALTVGSGWWATQFGGVAEIVITALGTSLLGYAVCLAWISGRDVTSRTGQTLALLDASWVVGTAVVLVVAGGGFTAAGVAAALGVAGIVAGFCWSQWRASKRVGNHPLSMLPGGESDGSHVPAATLHGVAARDGA